MGAFGVITGILQYAGLYIQLNAALTVGHGDVDNHILGNGELSTHLFAFWTIVKGEVDFNFMFIPVEE